MSDKIQFPEDFLWGTATASYQIEGGAWENGRGACIWDTFARTPGKVLNGDNGDVACDHIHRYEEDLDLLQSLGVQSYRFSIAWPRLFPEKGKFLKQGLEFYERLLEGLQTRNIKPAVTLYHWDLPQWIQDEGGWTNRDTVHRFLEYADVLFSNFGDRVPLWITHNEPWCASFLGYGLGVHAPGLKDWSATAQAAHHILLSHGKAVQDYRRRNLPGQIGITLNLNHYYPASGSNQDRTALELADDFSNRWFLDPVFHGRYPEGLKQALFDKHVANWNFVQPGDMEAIRSPIDFLGVNYYSGGPIEHSEQEDSLFAGYMDTGRDKTEMGWDIYPEGLFELLKRLQREYTGGLPLYITENGAAFPDTVEDGEVNDQARIEYLEKHFRSAHRFLAEGGPLKGYYIWSLMDNFEWAEGYSKRFGLIYVDYETLERIPKASAMWLKDVVRQNGFAR